MAIVLTMIYQYTKGNLNTTFRFGVIALNLGIKGIKINLIRLKNNRAPTIIMIYQYTKGNLDTISIWQSVFQ